MAQKVFFLGIVFFYLLAGEGSAQCCAGGSGSPVAGGTSQGVLSAKQFEVNTNLQFISSDKFYTADSRDTGNPKYKFRSAYQYLRFAYGVTKDFTMSIETGNYFYKEEIGLENSASGTYKSSGISDLVIFPRYDVLNLSTEKTKTEITLGLGYKIPIGSYNDSTGQSYWTSDTTTGTIYVRNPRAVQLTTGAQDIIFYSFFYQGYPKRHLRFFANALYILKGWNPLGEKMGDFVSVGLFASKSFLPNLGTTLQVRGELIAPMKINEVVELNDFQSDNTSSGYKKVFITPMINYSFWNFNVYALIDLPVYQYVTGNQVGTEFQATAGLTYRFYTMKSKFDKVDIGDYHCPMHPEVTSSFMGECPKCGMNLEKK